MQEQSRKINTFSFSINQNVYLKKCFFQTSKSKSVWLKCSSCAQAVPVLLNHRLSGFLPDNTEPFLHTGKQLSENTC